MTMDEFLEAAERAEFFGDIYSNYDHKFDGAVVAKFDGCDCAAAFHPAWNFHGSIIKHQGKYYELIMRYKQFQEIIEGDTLEEVIKATNDKYGYE